MVEQLTGEAAEARRIERDACRLRGWRRELWDRRFLAWIEPLAKRGEIPPRNKWPRPFSERHQPNK